MTQPIEQIREALEYYANEDFQSDVIDVGSCGVACTYDSDVACQKAIAALSLITPSMVLVDLKKVKAQYFASLEKADSEYGTLSHRDFTVGWEAALAALANKEGV